MLVQAPRPLHRKDHSVEGKRLRVDITAARACRQESKNGSAVINLSVASVSDRPSSSITHPIGQANGRQAITCIAVQPRVLTSSEEISLSPKPVGRIGIARLNVDTIESYESSTRGSESA
jgi:hypothetical protein